MSKPVILNRWAGALAGIALAGAGLLSGLSPAVAAAESCPNEAFRTGLSANLPECRAYEMVTPVDKSGGDVDSHFTIQTAPSGEALAYASSAPLPGSSASLAGGYNLSRRAPTGWTTASVDPPQLNATSQILTLTKAFSEDLSESVVLSRLALAPGAVEGNGNVYLQDNDTGQRTLIATSSNQEFFTFHAANATSLFAGGSSDFSRVTLESPYALTPDAVNGRTYIYEWSSEGGLKLINKLGNGSAGGHSGTHLPHGNAVAKDGRRVFFASATYPLSLYMTTDGGTPQLISYSQKTGDDPAEPRGGEFVAASNDGSIVYFTSGEQLTNAPVSGYGDIYRYEVETGRLQDITVPIDEVGGQVGRPDEVSSDGSYVYFSATIGEIPNLYVWHDGVTKLIANLDPNEYFGPEAWAMSPSGNWFAFTSIGHPTGYDNFSPACAATSPTSSCQEIYVYDAATEHVSCISCNPAGPPGGFSEFGRNIALISGYFDRNVLEDGQVFFQSTDALVPGDSNGKLDVYEWNGESVNLISSGTGDQEAEFRDASSDGSNVFFTTRQQLVDQDTDQSVDVYDARVDGGFPSPARVVACTGTACQGVPPAPPIFATPPSATFNGVGNFAAPATPAAKTKKKAKPKPKPKKKTKAKKHKSTKSRKQTKGGKAKKSGGSIKSSIRRAGRSGGKGR